MRAPFVKLGLPVFLWVHCSASFTQFYLPDWLLRVGPPDVFGSLATLCCCHWTKTFVFGLTPHFSFEKTDLMFALKQGVGSLVGN